MSEPMTDAELEAIRTMPFTTSLNVGCGVFATDEERALYRLAAENHNAKLALVAEVRRLRADVADRIKLARKALERRDEAVDRWIARTTELEAENAELRARLAAKEA